jgi:hypothetical protein
METKPIETVLAQIIDYYDSTRGVGHTHSALNGALNTPCNMVVMSKQNSSSRLPLLKNKLITLWMLDNLKGSKIPLVFDNSVLRELFQSVLLRIHELKAEYVGIPVRTIKLKKRYK